jgi:hypothetical protein
MKRLPKGHHDWGFQYMALRPTGNRRYCVVWAAQAARKPLPLLRMGPVDFMFTIRSRKSSKVVCLFVFVWGVCRNGTFPPKHHWKRWGRACPSPCPAGFLGGKGVATPNISDSGPGSIKSYPKDLWVGQVPDTAICSRIQIMLVSMSLDRFSAVPPSLSFPGGEGGTPETRSNTNRNQHEFKPRAVSSTYLDSEQQTKIYILVLLCFWPLFGQSWPQERAQRPRLEKRYIHQRKLARGIDPKAPRKLKSKIWP